MKKVILFSLTLTAVDVYALEQWRYFYGYADQEMVNLARSSGADPLAAVGREIPTHVPLQVPRQGGHFKVRFFQQFLGGGVETRGFSLPVRAMLVFDRAAASASALADQRLDASSFRKVAPRRSFWDSSFGWYNYRDTYSGFGSALAWQNATTIRDLDGDGIQDTATYELITGGFGNRRSLLQGVTGTGVSLRPVGIGGTFGLIHSSLDAASYLALGEAQHVMDVEFTSNLAEGETFGLAPEEPGLQIYCNSTGPYGGDNDLGTTYTSPSIDFDTGLPTRQYTGARYTLIGAVPEPSSFVVICAGLLLMGKRRRTSG